MEKITRIVIKIKNQNFALDIATGIMEHFQKLDVVIYNETDNSSETEDGDVVITEEVIKANSRVKKINLWIEREIEKKSGYLFKGNIGAEKNIICIYSQFGGNGVSSVAITLGRHLAVRSRENKEGTIYVTDDIKNISIYLGVAEDELWEYRKNDYLLKEGEPDITSAVKTDSLGMEFVFTEYPLKLIEYLLKFYWWKNIILDINSRHLKKIQWDYKIQILNCFDARTCTIDYSNNEDKVSNIFTVINNGDKFRENLCIGKDEGAFKRNEKGIDILMESRFAEDVEDLLHRINNITEECDGDEF